MVRSALVFDGVITEDFGKQFSVHLDNGFVIRAHRSGKIVKHRISLLVGDRVRCELCEADPSKGRIVRRF